MPEQQVVDLAVRRGAPFGSGWRLVDDGDGGHWAPDEAGTHDAFQFGTRLVLVSRK